MYPAFELRYLSHWVNPSSIGLVVYLPGGGDGVGRILADLPSQFNPRDRADRREKISLNFNRPGDLITHRVVPIGQRPTYPVLMGSIAQIVGIDPFGGLPNQSAVSVDIEHCKCFILSL